MKENFHFDSIGTYKTKAAPDVVVTKKNPQKKALHRQMKDINHKIDEIKILFSNAVKNNRHCDDYGSIKSMVYRFERYYQAMEQLEKEWFSKKREWKSIEPLKENLKDTKILISGKRRMLINIIKSINYNCEKNMQKILEPFLGGKKDVALNFLQNIWKLPGSIHEHADQVVLKLRNFSQKRHQKILQKFIDDLAHKNLLVDIHGRPIKVELVNQDNSEYYNFVT
jgi:hypothetical protein